MRVVDTSVFIDAERGHRPAVERIAELLMLGELAVSAVTVFELTRGPPTPRRLLAHYAELFGHEAAVLPVTHAAAQLAAETARLAGDVKAPDALIAGCAMEQGAPVVTSDADFRRLPGLVVEWLQRPPVVHEPEAAYVAPAQRGRIGARIRELRGTLGLRAAEVAAAAGMARSNYARLEADRHQPSLETLRRVAAAVQLPLAELLAPAMGTST